MKERSHFGLVILILVCIALGISAHPVCAQINYIEKIEHLEKLVIGTTFPDETLTKRVDRLEKHIFGKNPKWTLADSLSEMEKSLSVENQQRDKPIQQTELPINSVPLKTESYSTDQLLDKAIEFNDAGDVSQAEDVLREILNRDPSNIDANFSLGAILEKQKKFVDAQNCYKKVLQSEPSNQDACEALDSISKKMPKPPTVVQANKPECRDTWVEHGDGYFDPVSFHHEGPRKIDLRAEDDVPVQRSESGAELFARSAQRFKQGDYKGSIKDLLSYLHRNPNDARAKYALGKAYEADGDKESARFFFSQAAEDDPTNAKYQIALGDKQRERRVRGIPESTDLKNQSSDIVPMKPEAGERMYNVANSGLGKLFKYTLAGAAVGASVYGGGGSNMATGALQGALYGFAMGLLRL